MRIRLLLLAAILFWGCKSSAGPVSPRLGEEFSMRVGQQVLLDNGRAVLSVDSVEDWRCPLDVMCFWSGPAIVWCRLSGVPFALGIYTEPADTLLSSYRVKLTAVEPWPTSQHRPEQGEYIIRFIVTTEWLASGDRPVEFKNLQTRR